MRLIINLENTEPIDQIEREYIRNFIYACLERTKWSFYHDKGKYKHFSFSNLFPFNKVGQIDSDFKMIISSPYQELVSIIKNYIDRRGSIKLGQTNFPVIKSRLVRTPKTVDKVMTATPIILRLGKHSFEKYGIKSDRKYEFWEENKVLNAFLDLLIKNLHSRYENFKMESEMLGFREKYESYTNELRLFSTLKYKKTVFEWDKHFTGTMWEFGISDQYKDSDIVRYMFEAGLGERNASSGSGFLNLVKSNNVKNK